nr:MAG TPA: hypothetical protein [Caudoviricetes sp.]
MVYKSFLVDHHFCIFRGIFAPLLSNFIVNYQTE